MSTAKAVRTRRGFPIHGYVGPNGGGKTACMVLDTIPSLRAGRRVLSTVRILDGDRPRLCDDSGCYCDKSDSARHMAAHPLFTLWTDWPQLMDAEHCDVLADEITGIASSRDYSSLPSPVANLLVQLRRRDVAFRFTAPSASRSDILIRECAQAFTVCRGYFGRRVSDGTDRSWKQNQVFVFKTYDAALMADFETGQSKNLRSWAFSAVIKPASFGWFDTFDSVATVGAVSDGGKCLRCGGRRSAPVCGCPDHTGRGRRGPGSPPAVGGGVAATIPAVGADTSKRPRLALVDE